MDDGQDVSAPDPKEKEIEESKKQIEDLTANWKRAVADYRNLEKRVENEREEFVKFSNLLVLIKLIGVLDNLELVGKHVSDDGLDIVIKELKNIISGQGIKEVEVKVGDNFDPNFHECVELVAGEDNQKVVTIVAPGYIMNMRVIRPAKVKVSKKEVVA